jgi:type IV pilus assembly protein PilV
MYLRPLRRRTVRRVRMQQSGFSLIEVLISVLILLFGILGMAGMQVRATQAEFESYQRKQALLLLQDMVDRVRANRIVSTCYTITDATLGSPFVGTGATLGAQSTTASPCTAGGSGGSTGTLAQRNTAIADMAAWSDSLYGVSEKKGTDNVGVMLGARGCITDLTGGVVNVSIAWQGTASTSAPPSALKCGLGRYGTDDTLRRVVSTNIRLATLS